MAVNWGIASGPNAFERSFGTGLALGQELRERRADNALAAYVGNRTSAGTPAGTPAGAPAGGGNGIVATPEQEALSAELRRRLIKYNPQAAARIQQMEQEEERAALKQRRADLPLLTNLVESSTDEASYQRNRAVAQEYGIDTSTLPPAFDPAWRDQQLVTLKALQDPKKAEALSTAGKQAIDMGYKPGTPEFNKAVRDIWTAGEAKPYVVGGETRLYQPKIGGPGEAMGGGAQGGPAPGAVEDGYRFKGGNPADPSSWEPVEQGGGGARVTSGFLEGL